MPSANPFIDMGGDQRSGPMLGLTTAQYSQPGTAAVSMFTSPSSQTTTNAAGTSENVAMHVAIIIALALVAIFVFRQSGFRFAVAAGVGS